MTFGEKLKQLRSDKGFTQEELAQRLYVSRTAISKWESGRGFPNIESLKALATCFSVTVDELLSGDEWITLAEQDQKQKERRMKATIFGLLDVSLVLLLVLPFFAQTVDGTVREVPLLMLSAVQGYLKMLYIAVVVSSVLSGLVAIFWQTRVGRTISLVLSVVGVVLFTVGRQPYAALFVFAFLIMKGWLLLKRV